MDLTDLKIDNETLYYCTYMEKLCVLDGQLVSEPEILIAVSAEIEDVSHDKRVMWITYIDNIQKLN